MKNYAIPPTNPWVGVANTQPEIWAYGLRNPWRSAFDRLTGDLWTADVGQSQREEVNLQSAGTGGLVYGWKCREGRIAFQACGVTQPATDPIWDYTHSFGLSVTGGYVYRGCAIPSLNGTYFAADWSSNRI